MKLAQKSGRRTHCERYQNEIEYPKERKKEKKNFLVSYGKLWRKHIKIVSRNQSKPKQAKRKQKEVVKKENIPY